MRRRSLIVTLEVFAGLVVLGGVATALIHDRLNQGPVSLGFLVAPIEESINRELVGLSVDIADFTVQRDDSGTGMAFRLRNVRLLDTRGSVVARAPSAAVGLSGRALLWGRIAPGSVDFIGPRLLLFHTPESGLSLTFSRAGKTENSSGGARAPQRSTESAPPPAAQARRIDLMRALTAAFERARRGDSATSYLTRFGVKDALVIFDRAGKQSFWQVSDFSIELEHREQRSLIVGEASITSAEGPWRVSFRTEQTQKQQLALTARVRDLVPAGLAVNFPRAPLLKSLNLPVDAQASARLSRDGELLDAEGRVRLSAGHLMVPWERDDPMLIDEGDLHLRYRADEERVELLPSTIRWGESRVSVSGAFVRAGENAGSGTAPWSFRLTGEDSVLAAEQFGVPPTAVERLEAKGVIHPGDGRAEFERFAMQLGEGSVALAGTVIDAPGSPIMRMKGNLSPMPLSTLKRMWPKFLSAGARQWIGERVTDGHIAGGSVEIDMEAGMLANFTDDAGEPGEVPDSALRLRAEATGLEIHYIEGLPPIRTGDATLSVDGRRFALEVPEGRVTLPSGERITLTEGRFAIDDLRPDPTHGVVDFRAAGGAGAALELLDHEPLEYIEAVGLEPGDLNGRVGGEFRIGIPLVKDVEFDDIELRGRAELDEARATRAFGKVSVEGGTVKLDVTEKALEARGDILLDGVPASLTWQRIFGAPPEKQPELRLSAMLDENARKRLGLDLGRKLRGAVPVVLAMRYGSDGERKYEVRADLGNAEIALAELGWRKPPGRSAFLTFDLGKNANGNTELQNFNLEGDELGIEGWIALGPDDQPRAFYFSEFSFNVITKMEVAGERRDDGIWNVQAHGSAYDGRQFFRSLFSAGEEEDGDKPAPSDKPTGVDLTAQIGTVAGYSGTSASDVSINLKKRNGKLVALDASGNLNDESPIAVRLVERSGQPRVVLAEAEDAGSAFRLVGFYPRVEGGQASLKVNLDAAGPATTAGTLWARDFKVLGDRVVSQVLANAGDDPTRAFTGPAAGQGIGQRQRIPFDQLRVPFSVGGGRFELHDSYINGPRLGATLRGYVDFKSRQMEIGGTYIPVYGLNSALGSIPIIGNLLVGRRGEGVLGITFAIRGETSDPDVMVNPVSMVAPGILRQIFEYTGRSPENFPEQPRQSRQGEQRRQQPAQDLSEISPPG